MGRTEQQSGVKVCRPVVAIRQHPCVSERIARRNSSASSALNTSVMTSAISLLALVLVALRGRGTSARSRVFSCRKGLRRRRNALLDTDRPFKRSVDRAPRGNECESFPLRGIEGAHEAHLCVDAIDHAILAVLALHCVVHVYLLVVKADFHIL